MRTQTNLDGIWDFAWLGVFCFKFEYNTEYPERKEKIHIYFRYPAGFGGSASGFVRFTSHGTRAIMNKNDDVCRLTTNKHRKSGEELS